MCGGVITLHRLPRARQLVAKLGEDIGPITAQERDQLIKGSPLACTYDKTGDRESACERLAKHVAERSAAAAKNAARAIGS